MKPIIRGVLAAVAGVVVGSLVNILLVNVGPSVIPLPEGADVSTMESLQASIGVFTPWNFLFPFLGHALGTLVGAYVAAKLAASHHVKFALAVGLFFLAGGIAAVTMLGGPMWFTMADLLLAYIPMAFLGAAFAGRPRSRTVQS